MKGKKIFKRILFGAALAAGAVLIQSCTQQTAEQTGAPVNQSTTGSDTASPSKTDIADVPAHHESPPSLSDLKPVLPADQFAGKTREAYQAVKQIPVTIAQMPCYCHCDRGMGHTSLHSCFEDEHAANCAVCVDEALMAYRLQKEGLSALQIRERIIAEFSEP